VKSYFHQLCDFRQFEAFIASADDCRKAWDEADDLNEPRQAKQAKSYIASHLFITGDGGAR